MTTNRDVFNRIAPGWYNYRHRTIFRAELEALAGRWQVGRLLNVGCGHGADFLPFCNGFELCGLDFAAGMLSQAQRYTRKFRFYADLVLGDVSSLPFRDGSFDWAIAVATYHHVRGGEARLEALAELRRVLKPGGEAFVTVWNRWQPRFWFKGREVMVPWRTPAGTLYRYYHLFSRGELEKLTKKAGFTLLSMTGEQKSGRKRQMFARNICLLVRR